jgi:hypothetical protein
MGSVGYYDRGGNPITSDEWIVKFKNPEYKFVGWWSNRGGNPKVNGKAEVIVSTVWLGLNHAWDGGLLIFESMIFGGEYDQSQMRYATEQDALDGHQRIVDDLQAGRAPWFNTRTLT